MNSTPKEFVGYLFFPRIVLEAVSRMYQHTVCNPHNFLTACDSWVSFLCFFFFFPVKYHLFNVILVFALL